GSDDVLHAIEDEADLPAGETDEEGLLTVEHAECVGACGGAPVVQVNYELIEGITPEKAREMVRWLRNATPAVVNTDEMQELFGGQRSFDWAIPADDGAVGPYPAFQLYGTVGQDRQSTRLNSSHVKSSYAAFCLQKPILDRKSTRLNSSHVKISYAGFCSKEQQRR